MTNQVLALREHLIAERVTLVVMEATGDYWKPFYYLAAPARSTATSSMLSPPASIDPMTDSAFAPLFAPCVARCSRWSISPPKSIRCARTAAGSSPAFGTKFVSSKLTETRLSSWFARTCQMPSLLGPISPSQDRSSLLRGHLHVYGTPLTITRTGGSGIRGRSRRLVPQSGSASAVTQRRHNPRSG